MTPTQALYGSAATFGLVGLLMQIAPAQASRGRPARPAAATIAQRSAARTTTLAPTAYSTIVTSNLFSVDRIPPRTRFVPAGLASRGAPNPRATPTVRLYGITVGEQGAMALIDADPEIPGAEIYHVGDAVRGAQIVTITDSTVVLAQPSGTRVLRLRPSSRREQP